jgi:hypothetical protein
MAKINKDVVTIKIESSIHGHMTKTLPVMEAVCEVDRQTHERGMWLYVDGKFQAVDTTNADSRKALEETLRSARDITLAATLLGGC